MLDCSIAIFEIVCSSHDKWRRLYNWNVAQKSDDNDVDDDNIYVNYL